MSMDCISVCSLTTDHNFVLADSDSADEINSATNEIKSHLKITLLENEMMLRFIDNVEEGEVQVLRRKSPATQTEMQPSRTWKPGSHAPCTHRQSNSVRYIRLTEEQRCMIAKQEIDNTNKESDKLKAESEQILQEYRARLEEANIVAKETEMNRMHFDKNVTALLTDFQECPSDEAVKKRTEAFIRFHKSYMKHLVSTENNLRIENGSLLRRRKKDRKVLRDLNESEISPSQIEMEELQIRCNRALQKILQFAHVCAHMKSVLVRATHSMTIGRTELEKSLAESGWLQRECNHAEGLVKLVRGNMKTTETSLEEERRINDHLKLILKKYRVPSTITYVNNVVESSKLSRANRAYKNKLYLAKISLAKHKDLWSKIKKNLG